MAVSAEDNVAFRLSDSIGKPFIDAMPEYPISESARMMIGCSKVGRRRARYLMARLSTPPVFAPLQVGPASLYPACLVPLRIVMPRDQDGAGNKNR